jgi:hypothetical protein
MTFSHSDSFLTTTVSTDTIAPRTRLHALERRILPEQWTV